MVLALLVATAISLLTLDFRGFGPLQSLQRGARDALEPLVGAVGAVTDPVANVWRGVVDYDDVKEENERLTAEVAALRSEKVEQADAKAQLEELLRQQDITTAASIEGRVARVVAGPVGNLDNTLRIDKGSDDGIAIDMIVVTDAGLVGRIQSVTTNRAVVELADSRGFNVGLRLVGGGAQTDFLAKGQGPGKPLQIQGEVRPGPGIEDGAALVTSGLDRSLYPPDIPVGRITGTGLGPAGGVTPSTLVGTAEPAPLRSVRVELFVNPVELSFVTVLIWEPER
jgi:rod shape-determining protein MreC